MRTIQRYAAFSLLICSIVLASISIIGADLAGAQWAQPRVVVATIDGPTTPAMASYVKRTIDRANSDSAAAVLIELNTPGGEDSAVDDIVSAITGSDVPVIVWVGPDNALATSNSLAIVYAAGAAVMAPNATIGDAEPIRSGPRSTIREDDATLVNAQNEDIARLQQLAARTGRNADWVTDAVKNEATIGADEAVSLNVVNAEAIDQASALTAVDGISAVTANNTVTLTTTGALTNAVDLTWWESLRQHLADPTVAYLLLSFGIVAVYFELSNPGMSIPGLAGVIMLFLGLTGIAQLPLSWTGLTLMFLAFGFFLIDLFVPSLGLLTVAGLICFLVGSNALIAKGAPEDLQIPNEIIYTMTICMAVTAIVFGMFVMRTQFRRKQTGRSEMIGKVGTAQTALSPDGMVHLFGELWTARTEGSEITEGAHVEVVSIDGIRLVVKRTDAPESVDKNVVGDRRTVIPVR